MEKISRCSRCLAKKFFSRRTTFQLSVGSQKNYLFLQGQQARYFPLLAVKILDDIFSYKSVPPSRFDGQKKNAKIKKKGEIYVNEKIRLESCRRKSRFEKLL